MSMFDFARKLFEQSDEPIFSVPDDPHGPWQSEAHDELEPIKRMLVLLRPKQPFVDWINARHSAGLSLAQAKRTDGMSFLIPRVEGEIEEAEAFLSEYWAHFFAQMLDGWDPSGTTWPPKRTPAMFREWFEIEICDMVLDLGRYANQERAEREAFGIAPD